MRVMRLAIAAIALVGTASASPVRVDSQVTAIAEQTRRTTATYSLYAWNRVTLEGEEPRGDWSAEFHHSTKHRVETSVYRIIADCVSMEGTALNLSTLEFDNAEWVAKAACGINANKPITTSQFLGSVKTRFGRAKRVSMTDADNIRTYDVIDSGALVAATIADLDGTMRVENVATEYKSSVPEGDLFSVDSLATSVVADIYKVAPEPRR